MSATLNGFAGDFNQSLNKYMEPLFDPKTGNKAVIGAFAIFMWLYISFFAVKMPREVIPYMMNPWARAAFVFFALWLFTKNAGASILLLVAYGVTTTYLYKNEAELSAKVGYVTNELSSMISMPGIFKTKQQVQSETANVQRALETAKSTGVIVGASPVAPKVPEAVLSSTGGPSTIGNISIDDVPSGVPANNPSMMDTSKPHPYSTQPGGLYNGTQNGPSPLLDAGAKGLAPVAF